MQLSYKVPTAKPVSVFSLAIRAFLFTARGKDRASGRAARDRRPLLSEQLPFFPIIVLRSTIHVQRRILEGSWRVPRRFLSANPRETWRSLRYFLQNDRFDLLELRDRTHVYLFPFLLSFFLFFSLFPYPYPSLSLTFHSRNLVLVEKTISSAQVQPTIDVTERFDPLDLVRVSIASIGEEGDVSGEKERRELPVSLKERLACGRAYIRSAKNNFFFAAKRERTGGGTRGWRARALSDETARYLFFLSEALRRRKKIRGGEGRRARRTIFSSYF